MKALIDAFRRFSWQKKVVTAALVLLIVLTWLAVCLVLTGALAP